MKPTIQAKKAGEISINNKMIDFDISINLEGKVSKRVQQAKDELKVLELSLEEANSLYDPNANEMIIGSGVQSKLRLSNEATDFFEEKRCKIKLLPTGEAITYWNRYEGHAIGLFHV
jgi:hypothetical protein